MTIATMSPPSALRHAAGRHPTERFAAWTHSLAVETDRNGPFAASASESIAAPVDRLYAAFVASDVRRSWLPNVEPQPTMLRPARSVRLEWADGAEQVDVTLTAMAETEGWVTVKHTRLSSDAAAADAESYWQNRLTVLKALLEA